LKLDKLSEDIVQEIIVPEGYCPVGYCPRTLHNEMNLECDFVSEYVSELPKISGD